MSSRDILTITFSLSDKPHTLEYGKGMTGREKKDVKTITYKISDLDRKKAKIGELNDDGSKSLNEFTQKLTSSIKTFRALLPPSVTSYYDEKVVNELIEHQQHFMDGKSVANKLMEKGDTETEGDNIEYDPLIKSMTDATSKNELLKLYTDNLPNTPTEEDIKKQVTELVEKNEIVNTGVNAVANAVGMKGGAIQDALQGAISLNAPNDWHVNYNMKVLEGAAYLGKHTIQKESRMVFLTKDLILTDGYAILPINSDAITNGIIRDPDTTMFQQYGTIWKLSNKDKLNLGVNDVIIQDADRDKYYGPKSQTEYDVAVKKMRSEQIYGGGVYNKTNRKHHGIKKTKRLYHK